MNKLSQAYNYPTLPKSKALSAECNFCNNTDDPCCPEADKNQAVEREQRTEDELFNRELVRLGWGALVWGGE